MSTLAKESPLDAAQRIAGSGWSKNCGLVIMAFADRGIDPNDIDPKTNVFTYKAWRGKGRQVRKGEKGVRLTVYIPVDKRNKKTGKVEESVYPKSSTVFHISQTDPMTD